MWSLLLSCSGEPVVQPDGLRALEPSTPLTTGGTADTSATGSTGDTSTVDTGGTGDTGLAPEPCGPLVWARSFDAEVHDLVALPDGGFAAVGSFGGTTTFGAGDPNETTLTAPFGTSIWVATYDVDGSLRWVVTGDSYGFVRPIDLAAGDDGSLAVAGERDDKMTFGTGAATIVLDDHDLNDGFVAKYDPLGKIVFAAAFDSDTSDSTEGVAIAPDGEIYVTGEWGPGDLTLPDGSVFTNPGVGLSLLEEDGWVAKYETDGTFAWAHHLSGDDGNRPSGVAATATEVAFVGQFNNEIVIPNGSTYRTPYGGGLMLFLVQYAPDGTWMWDRIDGGPLGSEFPDSLVAIGTDWTAGGYSGLGEYGAGEVNETVFPNPFSLFAARWDRASGLLSSAHELVGSMFGGFGWNGGGVDAEGRWAVAGVAALSDVTLGPGTPRETTITAVNFRDPLVATFNPDGTFQCNWLLEGDGPETSERAEGVAFDGQGGIILTGVFQKHLTVAAGTPEAVTLTSTTDEGNVFLARFLLEPAAAEIPDTTDTGP